MKLTNLKKREMILIAFLSVIIVATIYYRKFHRPRSLEYQEARQRLDSAKIQKLSIESEMPNIISFEKKLKGKENLYRTKLKEIHKEEEKILTPPEITRLLETIIKSGLDMNIETVYIKSKELLDKKKEGYYTDYLIDFHYISSFANSVEYIGRLEKISDYMKIEEVKMEIEKEGEFLPHTYLVLSTIINEKGAPKKALKEVMAKPEDIIQRAKKQDPFTTKEKPYKKELPVELNLNAILWSEKNQAAIIDGQIRKVGDQIKELEVIEILPDRVILQEGNRLYELTREK